MRLYEINTDHCPVIHVVARSPDEAVELFITWRAISGGVDDLITVQRLSLDNLKPEQQDQVRRAFAAGFIGISHFNEQTGWTFAPPMWLPSDHRDQPDDHDGGQA